MTYSEPSADENLMDVSLRGIEAAKADGFDLSVWAVVVTLAGRPQINRPGWEITEVVPNVWQCVAISTRYRFCGQGSTPRSALEDARRVMQEFRKELNMHLEAT